MLNIYWSDRKVDWGVKRKKEKKKKNQRKMKYVGKEARRKNGQHEC
jgi:hypothetical protein